MSVATVAALTPTSTLSIVDDIEALPRRSWQWLAGRVGTPRRHRRCGAPMVVVQGQASAAYLCTDCDGRLLRAIRGLRSSD